MAMDLAAEQAKVEEAKVETKQEFNAEDLKLIQEKNKELSEMVDFLKNENEKYRSEAKKAFEARDAKKAEVRKLKEVVPNIDDIMAHAQQLEQQLQQKEKEYAELHTSVTNKTKIETLKNVAKQQGIKDSYLDKIDRFVDLANIDPEKPTTVRYAIDTVKASFPDLFNVSGERVDASLPRPKLSENTKNIYIEQYNAEKAKGLRADMAKMIELKKLISAA